ncbi:hypothetical protein BP6252_13981 [Coleophoma cylindrospora]|uniref:AAA+ ATPase domain-containing protein n=1 Tax=Coleophoma cylindrospora TaxID=1849047 RepID=A0A3D8Q541_9HELO|nr:hypothetical protein BP6252_13981 [Coleophoma cylindrospora]
MSTPPPWFMNHCIRTSTESLEFVPRLFVANDGDVASNNSAENNIYTITQSTYQSIRRLACTVSSNHTLSSDSSGPCDGRTENQYRFTRNAVLLKLPRAIFHGQTFLATVIDRFAKDIGAHLIRIRIEDIKELALFFSKDGEKSDFPDLLKRHFAPRRPATQGDLQPPTGAAPTTEIEQLPKQSSFSVAIAWILQTISLFPFCGAENDDTSAQNPLLQANGADGTARGYGTSHVEDSPSRRPSVSMRRQDYPRPFIPKNQGLGRYIANEDEDLSTSSNDPIIPFPFNDVLRAPTAKETMTGCDVLGPLIIHIVDANQFTENHSYNFLNYLREAIEAPEHAGRVVLIATAANPEVRSDYPLIPYATDEYGDPYDEGNSNPSDGEPDDDLENYTDEIILSKISSKDDSYTIRIAPMNTKQNRDLLYNDRRSECYMSNIRRIQLRVRNLPLVDQDSPFLISDDAWQLVGDEQSLAILSKTMLSPANIDSIAQQICHDLNADKIHKVLEQIDLANVVLKEWKKDPQTGATSISKNFPPHVQKVIKDIRKKSRKRDPKYKWESRLLDTLVDPGTIQHTWADIELKSSTKRRMIQLLDQMFSESKSNYGITATNRINGALLYGPPGTGKTHLARVLAKESRTTMLLASSAQLEWSRVGDTEKCITALFNLGRMVSPSIIFIDEADGLLASRKTSSNSWDRTRINQFLAETDGVRINNSQPFLILATNYPHCLDHAIFRRIPSRIYIGLPSTEARERILRIYLKDEILGPDIKMRTLATKTSRFSGSDLRTWCVQAALICQEELEDAGQPETKRCLEMSHFMEALNSCGPTVSKSSLYDIREFAREFDPSALSTMYADGFREDPKGSAMSAVLTHSEDTFNRVNLFPKTSSGTTDTCVSTKLIPVSSSKSDIRSPQQMSELAIDQSLSTASIYTVYDNLESTKSEIRLIEIVNGDNSAGDHIQCILHTVSLQDNPTYTALSYVWGDAEETEPISVNGVMRLVTTNLGAALRVASKHWESYFPGRPLSAFRLWVDAICINQENPEERNHQVAAMSKLYRDAELVISSVSKDDETAELAIQTFRKIHNVLTASRPPLGFEEVSSGEWLQRLPQLCKPDLELEEDLDEVGNAESQDNSDEEWHPIGGSQMLIHSDEEQCKSNKAWKALNAFGRLKYWHRIWITQEVVLAKNIILTCGKHSINFDDLNEISSIVGLAKFKKDCDVLEKPSCVAPEIWCRQCFDMLPQRPWVQLAAAREMKRTSEGLSPLNTWAIHRMAFELEASDPRDYVYGLLGLSGLDLDINYAKTTAEVYTDFAKKQLENPASMDSSKVVDWGVHFLAYAGIEAWDKNAKMPSWIPNFARMVSRHGSNILGIGACADRDLIPAKKPSPNIDQASLFITGTRIQVVRRAECVSHESDERFSVRVLDHFRDFIMRHPTYETGIPSFQAILRTLITDHHPATRTLLFEVFSLFYNLFEMQGTETELVRLIQPNFHMPYGRKDGVNERLAYFLHSWFPGYENMAENLVSYRHWHTAPKTWPERFFHDMRSKKFFEMDGGLVGLGPGSLRRDDVVCVLQGCNVPVILRNVGDYYIYIGQCFVLGLMEGEAAGFGMERRVLLERFEIR